MVKDFKEEEIWMTEGVWESVDWLNHNTDRSNLTLLNGDGLIVFQNLLQTNCFTNDLMMNGNSQGRSEKDELAEAINRIIELTDHKN